MNSITLYQIWDSLKTKVVNQCTNDTQNIYSLYNNFDFGSVYVSTNKIKDKAIIFYVKNLPNEVVFPNIKGLSFEMTTIPAISQHKTFIKISTKNQDCLEEAFEAFTVTLVEMVKNLQDPYDVIEAIFEVVEKYVQFFSDDKEIKLSKSEEQGLFGELLFIKKYLEETGDENVITAWTGPSKNKHDFIFPNNVGVEIKTTLCQTRKDLTISNENQLDQKERKNLYLRLYVLETNPNGTTIDVLVDKISSKLNNFALTKHFNQKLLENGVIVGVTYLV